ncbi:MAG: AAA family ATPase [Acidimicrobiia bacterium]|nr:AAA family ATPase [Acidimicrobiia bacterium]
MNGGHSDDSASNALVRVSVRGFRSLLDIDSLPIQPGITVLVGPNDSGKSALIDAIGWLLGEYNFDSDDRSQGLVVTGDVIVTGWFLPANADEDGPVVRVRLDTEGVEHRERRILIHADLRADPSEMKIGELREAIDRLSIGSPGGTRKRPLVAAVKDWLSKQPRTSFVSEWTAEHRHLWSESPGFNRFGADGGPDPRAEFRRVLAAEVSERLHGADYIDQIEIMENRLKGDVAPSHRQLEKKILEHCPDFTRVSVGASIDFSRPTIEVDLRFRQGGAEISFEKMGRGRRRRIGLAVYETELDLLESDTNSTRHVFAYDEPDTHLDHQAQRSLYDILTRQAALESVQVLIATHSINFLDKVDLASVVRMSLNSDRNTVVEAFAGESHESSIAFVSEMARSLGLRNSALVDRGCLLVVEGETEEMAVPQLYLKATGRYLVSDGVTILNTRGSGSIRRFVEMLAGDWERPVVVLADADAADGFVTWIAGAPIPPERVFLVGRKELEDAFDSRVWLRALTDSFTIADGETLAEADIKDALAEGKPSRALQILACQRTRTNVSKPDLGLALGNAVDGPDDIPSAILECFASAVIAVDSR